MSLDDALTHLPPILGAVIFGALELMVAISKPKTRLKRIFQFYLLAMFLWSFSAFMTLSGQVEVLVWFRIMTIAPISMTIAIFYFVQALFGLRRKWKSFVLVYGVLLIPLSLFTPALIREAALEGGKLHYDFGPLLLFVAIPGYGLNFFNLAELANGYSKSNDAIQRNRILSPRLLILPG